MAAMPPVGYRNTAALEIKRSRFVAALARTDDTEQAREFIAAIRARYPDARHHCTAFIVNPTGVPTAHSSDDGEPSGTAGRPMLTCLQQADLENVTVVVTRYFGGIKLGAAGLLRAYTDAVALAIAGLPRVHRITRPIWELGLPHAVAGRIQAELISSGAAIQSTDYDADGVVLHLVFEADTHPETVIARATQGNWAGQQVGVDVVELPVAGAD